MIASQPALTSQLALANRSLGAWCAVPRAPRSLLAFGRRAGLLAVLALAALATVFVSGAAGADPLVQQGSKITAGEESGNAGFGEFMAVSADGNTAVIGGPHDNNNAGAAWVFTRSGSTWTQQAKLVGDCTSSCSGEGTGESGEGEFGLYVAISADGDTVLIGGQNDNNRAGAAWVFTRSGSTWTQQGSKIVGDCTSSCSGEGTGESGEGEFGFSVALSGDGNTALIGGTNDNNKAGAAWVFTRSGSTWTQQGSKIVGDCTSSCSGEGTGESGEGEFGTSVALSTDGNTALISGLFDGGSVGAAWVFTRSGSAWTQQGAKLTGGGESGEGLFGYYVALSGDGNTALIGGAYDNNKAGAAWVFTRSGSAWTQQGAKLTGAGESGEGRFGVSVALSADGNTALIGGNVDNNVRGAAWAFTRSGSTWTQLGEKLTASDSSGLNPNFGESVGLSSTGEIALVGGGGDNAPEGQAIGVGAVWAFAPLTPSPPVNIEPPSLSVSGSAVEGQTLTVMDGSWTNNPTSFTHQWQRCDAFGNNCTPIIGATGQTYTPTASDVGSTVRVQETASNEAGASPPASSQAVGPVIAPPVDAAPPTISGTAQQSQELTETNGSWTNNPTSYSYQWEDCDASGNSCALIAGATGQTYTLTASDVGSTIRVQETASNEAGAGAPASSQAVGPVIAPSGLGLIAPPAAAPPHDTQITSSKVNQRKRSASFSFSAQGTVAGFQCELQSPRPRSRHAKPPKAAFSLCSSPNSYGHLRPGTYTFLVRAFNGAGADPSPASAKFTLRQSRRAARRR